VTRDEGRDGKFATANPSFGGSDFSAQGDGSVALLDDFETEAVVEAHDGIIRTGANRNRSVLRVRLHQLGEEGDFVPGLDSLTFSGFGTSANGTSLVQINVIDWEISPGAGGSGEIIHFTNAPSALDLVKAGKDVIVLRTFSKIYGMAGLRCGFAIARPDLLDPITNHCGYNFMPVPAVVAATASLKDPQLVPERRRINSTIRQKTFAWLDRNHYSYIPSESNCFLLDTRRPGKETREAMAKLNVLVGRVWPTHPTCVRVTVGTRDEMQRFQVAFQKVMTGAVAFSLGEERPSVRRGRNVLLS